MRTSSARHRPLISNLGLADRRVRLALGLTLLAVGLAFGSWWGAVGVVLVATGVLGFCPLYRLAGLSTRR